MEVEKNSKNATAPKELALAVLSGFFLTLAFPRWNLWPFAWVALIPLFYALEKTSKKIDALLLAFLAGFVFFLLSISWLRHVTVFGMLFVVVMEAFYWGILGLVFRGFVRRGILYPLLLAACWTGLEFLRSEVPVWGFGWNLLGSSQAPNLWVAQLASLGGVYAVSFLVFLGNFVIYLFLKKGVKKQGIELSIFVLFLGAAILFGWSRFLTFYPSSFLPVSVIQGNIPQSLKWDETRKEEILKIYLNLTELASFDQSHLVIWPEAAYPGFFNRELLADQVKEVVKKTKIPLLVGSPHENNGVFYNSAYLLDSAGEVKDRYDKMRLVPFGEYIPWPPVFGFLESLAYALGVSDFTPGEKFTVFNLEGLKIRFATLICFEDTFPDLGRKFVTQGADFLAVITNDAWFGHSSAPYQHLQASVFRAIENGVSVVRAANTGVSGFITPLGQVVERVRNQEGKDTFIIGGMTYPIILTKVPTLFQRGGWLFPHGCFIVLVLALFSMLRLPKKTSASLAIFLSLSLFGCIRLQGGAFLAKKNPDGEPKSKEVSFDTSQLVLGKKQAPGRIEVYE